MNDEKRAELIERVKAAFAKTHKPPKSRTRRDDDELEKIIGRRWVELTIEDIEDSFLGFFTCEGFCYYLPAYLIGALLNPNREDLAMGIIRSLTPHTSVFRTGDTLTVTDAFTIEQKAVIRRFFETYNDLFPIEDALADSRLYLEDQRILDKGIDYWRQRG
jgi:hypothetical protein